MGTPLAALLAVAGGFFGRDAPIWGALLLAGALWSLARGLTSTAGRTLACLALGALGAAGWWGAAPRSPRPLALDQPLRLRGGVAEDPSLTEDGYRLFVDLWAQAPAGGSWSPTDGRVLLRVAGTPRPPPGRGDAVIFTGRLRRAQGLRNPGGSGYEAYLERKGVDARASPRWPGEVTFAAPGPGAPVWLRWRRAESRAMAEAVPGQAGAVLAAMTLGDWSGVARQTSEAFRRAGTTHLIAISGLHLGILALLLLPAARAALVRVPRLALAMPVEPLARVAVLPALAAYAALSGFQISTLRALVMACLVVAAQGLSRPTNPLGVLAAGAALLASLWPPTLGDPGLHLSIAALAGLFWLAPRLEERLRPAAKKRDPLARFAPRSERVLQRAGAVALRLACASVAASAATVPISCFHFGSASLWGFVVNPLAVPLVEFVCLPVGLLGTILHAGWPAAGAALWRVAGTGLDGLLAAQTLIPVGTPMLASPVLRSPAGLLGALGLVAALGLALDRRGRTRAALLTAGVAAAALLLPPAARLAAETFDPRVHLWALDVGQGQSLLLRLPGRRWVLVDAGGFPGSAADAGERVVAPALEALGVSRLWLAVSTHPHPDHVLGLPSVIRRTRPPNVWLPAAFEGDERYAAVLDAARSAGARPAWVGSGGMRVEAGRALLEAVAGSGPGENDRSLVLRVSFGDKAAMLPADLEIEGQRTLLGSATARRCDVLVAPHHGSRSALFAPFLAQTRPAVVLISASGRPGLPSAEFLAAARALPARVLTTFEHGCLHASLGPGELRSGPAR